MSEPIKANVGGMIQAAATTIKVKDSPGARIQKALENPGVQKMISDTVTENRGAFVATMIDLYSSDSNLAKCEPALVIKEAIKAVALNLPISKQLGFAYIIPYKDWKTERQIPQFQLGYKGLIQLAMRTGAYKFINAGNVYEGMLKEHNKLTGMVDLSGHPDNDTVVGYFAYLETLNGFIKAYYWTVEDVMAHAKRYVKMFNPNKGVWKDNFHEMAQKTVLRNLLSKWALLSVETQKALAAEEVDLEAADDLIMGDDEDYISLDAEDLTVIP